MINKVILQGRLTRDVEMRQTTSGRAVAKLSIATNNGYKDKDGNEQTTFTNCTAWGATAEFLGRYFTKGQEIVIDGRLENADYTDKNGVKHYAMQVNIQSANFCGSKAQNAQPQQPQPSVTAQQAAAYSQIGYRQETPQAFVQDAVAQGVTVQQDPDLSLGNMGDFEELISDGDMPF